MIRRHDDSPKHYPGYNHVVLGHGRLVCNNVDGDIVCFVVDGKGTRAAAERDAGAAAPRVRVSEAMDAFEDIANTSGIATGSEWVYVAAGECERSIFLAHTADKIVLFFLRRIQPNRHDLTVTCESTFNWYWLAAACMDADIELNHDFGA